MNQNTTDENQLVVNNFEGIKEYLEGVKFPVYFLDFEAITNSKEWMFNHGLDTDQQLSSFSILRIDSLDDDETKIKHYSHIGIKENYKAMANSLTDFYKGNGSLIVWGRDLEVRGIAKLIKEADEGKQKKLGLLLANMVDLQQLFYHGSFFKIEPSGKSSLDVVAKVFGVYKKTKIKDGKNAHYILGHVIENNLNEPYIKKIRNRILEYNNSDVINIKRVFVEIINELNGK